MNKPAFATELHPKRPFAGTCVPSTDGSPCAGAADQKQEPPPVTYVPQLAASARSEEHTSELQSLMRISYAVFCLKKKNIHKTDNITTSNTKRTHQHITT